MSEFFQLVTACHDDALFNQLMGEIVAKDEADLVLVDAVAAFRALIDGLADDQGVSSDELLQHIGLGMAEVTADA